MVRRTQRRDVPLAKNSYALLQIRCIEICTTAACSTLFLTRDHSRVIAFCT